MKRLEVRCCCQPQKLLGWLPVEAAEIRQGRVHRVTFWSEYNFDSKPEERIEPPQVVELPIAIISTGAKTYAAVKAEGAPIETLRQLFGFEENHE